jgi:hypothetical protein
MKYAVEMGSGAMTYIPCFIKNGSGILKLMEGYTNSIGKRRGKSIPVTGRGGP